VGWYYYTYNVFPVFLALINYNYVVDVIKLISY